MRTLWCESLGSGIPSTRLLRGPGVKRSSVLGASTADLSLTSNCSVVSFPLRFVCFFFVSVFFPLRVGISLSLHLRLEAPRPAPLKLSVTLRPDGSFTRKLLVRNVKRARDRVVKTSAGR